MPRRPITETDKVLAELRHKKRIADSKKAVDRSRRLVAGSKELVARTKELRKEQSK
jgi:hypothetical protein